ncbi:MAG: metallophosphoesterase [Desulfitobacteriaceae bacterium]|nr:metallophosphoesterase [Desulfitobacteriaceae bacterium]MDI6913200.1 metallophosphoesterase [Desulfitobacteriaceae bacterium]
MSKIESVTLRLMGILFLVLLLLFIYAHSHFRVDEGFTALPLNFDPYTNSSHYEGSDATVDIQGGFVKGLIREQNGKSLLLRSISPSPTIRVKKLPGASAQEVRISLENVDPLNTEIQHLTGNATQISGPHMVSFSVPLNEQGLEVSVSPKNAHPDYTEFVMLGDNRNGYRTFGQILNQINGIRPIFAVDDGDLVFGGEPNKYRLFNETLSSLQVPLYTTLGNHDIRENGRGIYTELYGPPYYSFDYAGKHFAFLDSSRGWTEKRAIPEEQYRWLEQDLRLAQGKPIYLFSHIPPTDPRTYKDPNTLPNIPGVAKQGYFERMMNNYTLYKSLNHGFPDPEEAARFERLMEAYHVDTVFLSHIHSYFSYIKNNVRYIISGGGGAELLSENSYYHFLRVKLSGRGTDLEMVELPSPPNAIMDRYLAAGQLFARSLYKEYTTVVWAVSLAMALLLGLFLWRIRHVCLKVLRFSLAWLKIVGKEGRIAYKKLKEK